MLSVFVLVWNISSHFRFFFLYQNVYENFKEKSYYFNTKWMKCVFLLPYKKTFFWHTVYCNHINKFLNFELKLNSFSQKLIYFLINVNYVESSREKLKFPRYLPINKRKA